MKIVVTGALGHIGSAFIRHIATAFEAAKVVLVDDLSTQRYASLFDLPTSGVDYTFVESRVHDANWDELLEEASAVVHLAATTDAAGTADKPELVHENNFQGTEIVATACLKNNVPLIFPSSTSVYGSQDEVVDENCPEEDLQPQSPYAACKIREEKYLLDLAQRKGLKVTICRLGTIFGTSSGMRFHTAVNKFCWQAVMGQEVTVWETALHQKRPYLGVDDCCQALCHIIEKGLYGGEVYNIVSQNFTVNDVLEAVRSYIPTLKVSYVKHKIMNQLSYEALNQKFCETGFTFKGSLAEGISDTVQLLSQRNVA